MPAVEIAQHWVDELAGLQPEPHTIDLTAVVDTALQQYAYRQRQEKITRERQWYEANHAEIRPYSDLIFHSCKHRYVNHVLPVVKIKSE